MFESPVYAVLGMSVQSVLIPTLSLAIALLTGVWLLSLYLRDVSIVDICWGLGFVVITWFTRLYHDLDSTRSLLLCVLVTCWGVRLSAYLLYRNWGEPEDRRYVSMRDKHGDRFWIVSLFTVFVLQALLMWFISFPVQFGQFAQEPLDWLDALGVAMFLIGLFFETVGDWQLAIFKRNAKNDGTILDRGLWRLTRHPNYFGDFCVWWGLFLIAVSAGAVWTILSPLLMSFLLLRVSGVKLLENSMSERRPDYAAYKRRTNAFFPWQPKAASDSKDQSEH